MSHTLKGLVALTAAGVMLSGASLLPAFAQGKSHEAHGRGAVHSALHVKLRFGKPLTHGHGRADWARDRDDEGHDGDGHDRGRHLGWYRGRHLGWYRGRHEGWYRRHRRSHTHYSLIVKLR